jgi:hypothetical protein
VFETAHPGLVKAAKRIKIEDATKLIVDAVGPVPPRKFATMFKLCFPK